MKEYKLSRRARKDINEALDYIALDSVRQATRMADRLTARLARLAEQPFLGTSCDELLRGLRYFVVKSLVIYYLQTDFGIEVVRVLHGAQDAPTLFDEGA